MYEKIPVLIARQLMSHGEVKPDRPKEVSVMFAGIHRLCHITDDLMPEEIVHLLSSIFACIDAQIDQMGYQVHKIDVRPSREAGI